MHRKAFRVANNNFREISILEHGDDYRIRVFNNSNNYTYIFKKTDVIHPNCTAINHKYECVSNGIRKIFLAEDPTIDFNVLCQQSNILFSENNDNVMISVFDDKFVMAVLTIGLHIISSTRSCSSSCPCYKDCRKQSAYFKDRRHAVSTSN